MTDQNITVGVVVNDILVLSDVKVTDKNGTSVLDIIVGENYLIGIRHGADWKSQINSTLNYQSCKNCKYKKIVTQPTTGQ